MARKTRPNFFSLSQTAGELEQALCSVSREDAGTCLLAERIARAIETTEGGGQRSNRPMWAGVLFGGTGGGKHIGAAPLDLIAETLARTWLGKMPDGSAPYSTIHCAQYYPGQHPDWLKQLLGPPQQIGAHVVFSDLSQYSIEDPHRTVKTAHEMIPYERWLARSSRSLFSQLNQLSDQTDLSQEITEFNEHIVRIRELITKRYAPYYSVVLFQNVDLAPPEFISQVLIPIVTTGKLPLSYGGGVTDFSRSIVLMTAQDRDGIIPKGMTLGFALPDTKTPSRRSNFLKVQKEIFLKYRWGTLIDAAGDELIIIGARTKNAQQTLLRQELEIIQQRLEQHGIFAAFTPKFKDWLLWQTRKPQQDEMSDESVWTDAMLKAALDRFVRNPLATVALAKRLFRGVTVTFKVDQKLAQKRSRDAVRVFAPDPPLDAQHFDAAYLKKALQESMPHYPDTDDVRALEQHAQAVKQTAEQKLTPPPKDPSP